MSVINRIEVANLLNKHGDIGSPWDAKMRHLLLDLRGQSSAISMENGFGKTTLAEALIGLLARDRTLLSRTRTKCSPSNVGGQARSWTHLRVEFRAGSGGAQSDLLAESGLESGGETFVFGCHGYSDSGSLGFYHYAGRLEQLPVHYLTRDDKLALSSNADFLAAMKALDVQRGASREEWLDAVGEHISRRELAQLAAFQKEGGADKSQIFNAIRPRAGEKPDQAFFFEVLAPQILLGAMRGESDENEELIEEVILNSGHKVSTLRHNLDEAERDQKRAEHKVAKLSALNAQGLELIEARVGLSALDDQIEGVERLLGGGAIGGLPGLPASDEEPASWCAWGLEEEGRPRVAVALIARLCAQSSADVEAALTARGQAVAHHRRLVALPEAGWLDDERAAHLDYRQARDYLKQHAGFADEQARRQAVERFEEAIEAFESAGGNPYRVEVIADRAHLASLEEQRTRDEREVERLETERERLDARHQSFADNQSFYQQALSDGLFDAAELDDLVGLEALEARCQAQAREAFEALSSHQRQRGEWARPYADYLAFIERHPGDTPETLLELKEARSAELEERITLLEGELETIERDFTDAQARLDALALERQPLQSELDQLGGGVEAWREFQSRWPDQQAAGLWHARRSALDALEAELGECQRRRDEAERERLELVLLEQDAERYRKLHGDEEPVHLRQRLIDERQRVDREREKLGREAQRYEGLLHALKEFREESELTPEGWLKDARGRYPKLLREREALLEGIEAREAYLERLSEDPLARQQVEAEAHACLNDAGIEFVALHQRLSAASEDAERRRAWLAQAAGCLFAPVVDGVEQAERAARLLLERNLATLVLEGGALAARIEAGQPPLGAVVGLETLAVKAALDPRHLDELRTQTEQRMQAERLRLAALDKELERLDPEGYAYALAQAAAKALELEVETALPKLSIEASALAEREALLDQRLSPEGVSCIQGLLRFIERGGAAALEQTLARLAEADERLPELRATRERQALEIERFGALWLTVERFHQHGGEQALTRLEAQLALLDQQRETGSERRAAASERRERLRGELLDARRAYEAVFADGERVALKGLVEFLDAGGDGFMATADQQQALLDERLQAANRRAGFDFERVRGYLEVVQQGAGGKRFERELAELKGAIKEARDGLKAASREHAETLTRITRHRRVLSALDRLGHAWLERLRQLPKGWRERIALAPAGEPDESMRGLDAALDEWRRSAVDPLETDADADRLLGLSQRLLDGLEALRLGERGRERDRLGREIQRLELKLGKALFDALEGGLFNALERARLEALSSLDPTALDGLEGLHAQLTEQLAEHRQRVEQLNASRGQIEETLVERLGSITVDAAANLDILKRVAKRSASGGAFFEVRAELIELDQVHRLIEALLAEIDEHLDQRRRRETEDANQQAKRDAELTKRIRQRIYRGLFTHVSIRLKHDAIRPHGRLFSLNEGMSEGQREAVSLMWLVKLSEFAIERELRELSASQRSRGQAQRESVILLDGLFSKLSHRKMIQDSLESLRNTRGRFQMIGLIHNPNYENDPGIFPTYLVGSVIGARHGQGGHVLVRNGEVVEPEAVGRSEGEASLFGIRVREKEG